MMPSAMQEVPVTETVTPADEAAVSVVLREAYRNKTPVYPIGGGTCLAFGLRPTSRAGNSQAMKRAGPPASSGNGSPRGIGLSTACMSRIVDHPVSDLTITVEAGLTIAELNRRLMSQGQWLPIDVPQPGKATVGGVVATNACGPRRYAYGTVRDYLLGIRAVDGRGMIFAGGGRVVKNAAGYNIPRLLAGSHGTVGVITQVTFLVRALPRSSALVLCDVPDFEDADRLLTCLSRSQTLPVAIELLAGRPRAGCPLATMQETSAARLIVGFDGGPGEVQWMVHQLSEEWRRAEGGPLTCIMGDDAYSFWNWLNNAAADVEINVLAGETVNVVEQLAEHTPSLSVQAHAGNGVIKLQWPKSEGPSKSAAIESNRIVSILRRKLRPIVDRAGGNLVVYSLPEGAELTAADIWGPPRDGDGVMRAILERFDPEGILNPGRFAFQTES